MLRVCCQRMGVPKHCRRSCRTERKVDQVLMGRPVVEPEDRKSANVATRVAGDTFRRSYNSVSDAATRIGRIQQIVAE